MEVLYYLENPALAVKNITDSWLNKGGRLIAGVDLYDENQEVAKLFMAECTPEFYLFNYEKKLIYRGRMDSSSPGNDFNIDGKDLRNAIDSFTSEKKITNKQFPSMGCNIKWK